MWYDLFIALKCLTEPEPKNDARNHQPPGKGEQAVHVGPEPVTKEAVFWGNVGRKVLQFSCTGAPQITKYSFFVELRESQCLATTRACLESFEAGTILFMWSVKTCLLKNNEIIVERSELPFPQHLSHFNSEFILG